MFKITIDENSELPNLKNNTNIHFLRLFYVAAFSTTFILLKTKIFILATHCTNKSKSAEKSFQCQLKSAVFSQLRYKVTEI